MGKATDSNADKSFFADLVAAALRKDGLTVIQVPLRLERPLLLAFNRSECVRIVSSPSGFLNTRAVSSSRLGETSTKMDRELVILSIG